jgi:hypothetical protein
VFSFSLIDSLISSCSDCQDCAVQAISASRGARGILEGVSAIRAAIGERNTQHLTARACSVCPLFFLSANFQRCPACKSLLFIGHSLGGALAMIAALDYKVQQRTKMELSVFTIGQPRVGMFRSSFYFF